MTYVERTKELKRSHNYRELYLEANPGIKVPGISWLFYLCPYCGRMVRKSKVSVDHIHSVRKVQTCRELRAKFKALPGGVNNLDNLVACCLRCNQRKGRKGGLWVFRGKYGVYFAPVIRFFVFVVLFGALWWLWSGEYLSNAVNLIMEVINNE